MIEAGDIPKRFLLKRKFIEEKQAKRTNNIYYTTYYTYIFYVNCLYIQFVECCVHFYE